MGKIIFEVIVNLYSACLLTFFLERFLKLRTRSYPAYLAINVIVYTGIITYLNTVSFFEGILGFLIYVIVLFVVALLFLGGSLKEKLYYSLLEIVIMNMVSLFFAKIMSIMGDYSLIQIYSNSSTYRVIGVVAVQIIATILLVFFDKIKYRYDAKLNEAGQYMILSILILSNIMYLLLNNIELHSDHSLESQWTLFFVLLCLIATNVVIFYLIQKITNMNQQVLESEKLKQNIVAYENNTKEICNKYEQFRQMKHDIRNAYGMIAELVKNNQREKLEQYLESRLETIGKTDCLIYTGNTYSDALLNVKFSEMKHYDIKLVYMVSCLKYEGIDEGDICSILGNLLDNGIDASLRMKEAERKMEVKIQGDDTKITIKVVNRIEENPTYNNKKLQTIKKDKNNHGIGTKIIEQLAKKYNGSFVWEMVGCEFRAMVLLYRNVQE